jgi:hypothetical protein
VGHKRTFAAQQGKEKTGFSSSLPPVWQLNRANFPPTQTPLPPAFLLATDLQKGETG